MFKNKHLRLLCNAIIILIIFSFVCCDSCKLEDINNKKNELIELCQNKKIKELSIVTSDQNIYYVKVENKILLNEFKTIITKNTFIPDIRSGQFKRRLDLTIKTKEGGLYTLKLYIDPYDPGIRKDAVDITFYKDNIFDVYVMFDESKTNYSYWSHTSSKYGRGTPCIQLRNYKLSRFIKKYVDEAIKSGSKNKYGIYVESREDI